MGLGIKTKIGITTGEAFLGDVGNTERREYAVVGDIVACTSPPSATILECLLWALLLFFYVLVQLTEPVCFVRLVCNMIQMNRITIFPINGLFSPRVHSNIVF